MKRIKRILAALCCVCLLAACGNDESAAQDVQRTVDDAAQKAEDAANDTADAGEKTVDDMMAHLREMQEDIQQEEVIEDIPFAAYDGRSFQVEGNTMYLYRINAQDAIWSGSSNNCSRTTWSMWNATDRRCNTAGRSMRIICCYMNQVSVRTA